VCLCLQVLEHIPDAAAFAQRLLARARWHVIISVPYKWAASRSPNHIHDPVDEAKLATWFGRSPPLPDCARATGNGADHLPLRCSRATIDRTGRTCSTCVCRIALPNSPHPRAVARIRMAIWGA
jgi:hypothetical protein